MRHGMAGNDQHPSGSDPLDELVAEPALANSGISDDADDLPLARHRSLECVLEHSHVAVAADELRKSARSRDFEPAVESPNALKLVDPEGLFHSFDREFTEILKLDEPFDELRRVIGEV